MKLYTPPCISATLFSQSPRALNSLFLLLLRSSSCLPGNNSPFLFCWIYVIDLGFLLVGYMIVWIWNQNFRTYFGWEICCCCCFCFFMGCGFIWVFGCFWDLPIFGFDYNYCFIFVDTHRYHWNQTPVFCFWWVGNKWMKEFSLLCFSFKNHDCVYGLLIKIQFLTFFSDKKLNGYCKCTSSMVFVYPLYARWPSVFDRFWNLFMCAAGELRVRMSISMCL